jgi:hypothetical protein
VIRRFHGPGRAVSRILTKCIGSLDTNMHRQPQRQSLRRGHFESPGHAKELSVPIDLKINVLCIQP